jgi:branched-chain amino acid transport system permease protein
MDFDPSILFVQFISGLCRAMVLFLMASGLTLVFGVMRVINFAHGAFYMLGAYLAFSLTQALASWPGGFWIALIVAPIIVSLIGGAVEYFLLRRIYDREHLLQILLTYALIFVFNDIVKMIWGVDLRIVNMPQSLSGFVPVLGHTFPVYYFFIIGMGLLVALLIWFLLRRTKLGRLLRASAEHRDMVGLLGYNVERVFTIVFMMATWLGGLAGVIIAPTVRLSLGMDMEIIIEAFLVVIVGGLGNVWGALLGALIIGQLYALGILVIEKFAMAFLFSLAAIIILFRPSGLLGKPVEGGG